jgi:hypothetical protein
MKTCSLEGVPTVRIYNTAWGFYPEAWAGMILRIVQSYLAQWFPKCDPRVPKDLQPLPRESVGTSVMATLNFTYFLDYRNYVL